MTALTKEEQALITEPTTVTRMLALGITAFITLTACGDSDAPTSNAATETQASSAPAAKMKAEEAAEDARTTSRLVNSLTFEASGDVAQTLQSDGSDLMLVGGCIDDNVIGMSFVRGQPTDPDLFLVRLRTAGSVAPGETGVFELAELNWYNGQRKPEDLPTDMNIFLPNDYEGAGILTLTTHVDGGLNGRLVGSVEGAVRQTDGNKVANIAASFDINLGCTNRSLNGLN